MTAPTTADPSSIEPTAAGATESSGASTRSWRRSQRVAPGEPVPPLGPGWQLARAALVLLFLLAFSLLVQLIVTSAVQQRSAQQGLFDRFRLELAQGTAPVGPLDGPQGVDGDPVPVGAPIAYLEIPALGLSQVVVQGTTPAALFDGPGHRRDSVFPGQAGTSVVMGRRAAFGGPFSGIGGLEEGDAITVTTGQGIFEYLVIGVRREGDPAPEPISAGEGRLLLATADGRPFFPDGVLRVDAELESEPVGGARPLYTPRSLPRSEMLMAYDISTLWTLALWLQALILVALGAVWSWHHWGKAQTWIIFFPVTVVVALFVSSEVARFLPNLL